MKKLKLLSSLSALLLVLSVGACDRNVTEDSSSDEVTSSESDSSSSESTPAPVELSNYTISISFVDAEQQAAAIPEYGTAYIIGSWDSWTAFIPLTENEGKYTYTFDTITEGSYTYKVVEWYEGEDVGWNSETETNCVEITAKDQTLVVSGSEGDNATHEITITLDVELPEPLTEEEIVLRVLQEAYEAGEAGIPSVWDATHAEVNEDPDEDGEYLTQDDIYLTSSSRQLYGYWKSVDLDLQTITESYYISGTKYIHEVDDDEGTETYSTLSVSDTYASIFESSDTLDFFEVFEKAEGVLDDVETNGDMVTLEALDYTYSDEANSNTVVIKEETEYGVCTYTYVADRVYNLTSISFEDTDEEDGKAYTAEKSSADAVVAIIDAVDFGPWIYDTDEDPVADMFASIKEDNNFTLTIEYYDWYSDYYEDYDQMRNEYVSGDMSVWGHDYYVVLTYTEDAVLMEYYNSYYEYYYGLVYDVELYVNGEDGLKIYYVNYDVDDAVDYTNLYLDDTVEDSTWQDEFRTLLDLVSSDYTSSFVKGQTSVGGRYGTTTNYSVNFSYSFMNTLCNCMFDGGNWFGDYFSYFLYYWATYYYYYGIVPTISATYYAEDGELDVSAVDFVTFTYTTQDGGYLYQMEYDSVYASISDVGTSAISEAYASYLQA